MPSIHNVPQRLLTWVGTGSERDRELDTPTILASLQCEDVGYWSQARKRDWAARSCAFSKAGLAVVRFVSEVGSSVACAVPSLAER